MDDMPTLSVTVDGDVHTVDFGSCTGLDASACRRATGLSIQGLFQAASEDPDLDVVAAVIWLSRRQNGEPNLNFEEVASQLDYGTDIEMADDEDGDSSGGDSDGS